MEPKLIFQVPTEGLEMLILQHRQYYRGDHRSCPKGRRPFLTIE